jgi:ribulose-phosphate 3-epimerase
MRDLRLFECSKVMVSPSLLAADFANLERDINTVSLAGAKILHLDVMDGHLVPNISFGIPVISMLRKKSDMLFDTHLMISEPARYAAAFAKAGADHLTFHIESQDNTEETIKAIRDCGCTVGISLRPGTAPEAIMPYLDKIDLVLVMTVEPGFGGQKFMPDMLDKIAAFKREIKKRNLNVKVEVDGGIDGKTAPLVTAKGAEILVAGTAVFRHPAGMEQGVREIISAQSVIDTEL